MIVLPEMGLLYSKLNVGTRWNSWVFNIAGLYPKLW